jgi:hypothetical protein
MIDIHIVWSSWEYKKRNWVVVSELPDGISVPGNNGSPRLIEFCLFGGSQVPVPGLPRLIIDIRFDRDRKMLCRSGQIISIDCPLIRRYSSVKQKWAC